jgi:predicted amidophosphoribosyltransferase
VHALKYGGLPRIADDLAATMARVPLPDAGAAWLVPVPLAAQRLRARGYNQSECLARHLAHRWRCPVRHLLVRTRETATQTALTPAARLANVAGAFSVRNGECGMRNEGGPPDSAFRIRHSALILIDDVFTTGATLAAAARALQDAGAPSIMAVTFGRALIPDFT